MPFLPPEALVDRADISAAATQAIHLARRGDPRAGLVLVQKARLRAQDLDMPSGEVEALNAAALVHHMSRNPIAAAAAALDARDLARRTGDASLQGHARVTLAIAGYDLEAEVDVEPELEACIAAAVEARDGALECRARLAYAVVLGDRERFGEAHVQLIAALQMSAGEGCTSTPARILANLANLHRKRALHALARNAQAEAFEQCTAALDAAARAEKQAAAEGYLGARIDALAIAGCVHALRGDDRTARVHLGDSVALARASRYGQFAVWVLCELGRLELRARDAAAARAAFAEGLDHALELRPCRKITTALEGLAEAAALRGDREGTRLWREQANAEARVFDAARVDTRRQLETAAAA